MIATASVNSQKIIFLSENGLKYFNNDHVPYIRSLEQTRLDNLVSVSNNTLIVWNINSIESPSKLEEKNLIDKGLFVLSLNSTHYVVATLMDILIFDKESNSMVDKLQDG